MADIQLRFDKDMLVIGGSVQAQLAMTGAWADAGYEDDVVEDDPALVAGDGPSAAAGGLERLAGVTIVPAGEAAFDTDLALLLEPEVFEDPFRLEKLAGAQCLVAPTAGLTPARLAHTGMRDAAFKLARTAIEVTEALVPEHVLVEIAPCGLPLDGASKASLMENRKQYERAARLFEELEFDAFFLNGFTRTTDLKCALMGLRKVSDAPVLASVDVDAEGMLCPIVPGLHPQPVRESLEEAVAVMAEHGAQVAGFCTGAGPEVAVALAARIADVAQMPILAQLFLEDADDGASGAADGVGAEGGAAWPCPEAVYDAGLALAAAGVQFVRVTGDATPACTGALAAAVAGSDVGARARTAAGGSAVAGVGGSLDAEVALDALAEHLRASVNDALGIGGAR